MFDIFKSLNKNEKKLTLYALETQIVDNCNLKCNKCSHFSHLINEEIRVDVNDFEKDMERLSKYFLVYNLKILGGEPLLHPEINTILEIARRYFPKSIINITTNGLLLKKMNSSFWETMKRNRIAIELSKYPILGNGFSELLDLIDDNNVELKRVILSKKFSDTFNLEGSSNPDKAFHLCGGAKIFVLFQHKIYPCIGAYRYYWNKINNTNLPLPPEIDLYNCSQKEIHRWAEKIKQCFEACRYCDDIGKIIPWEPYKGQ